MTDDRPIPLIRSAAIVDGLAASILARLATDADRQGRFDRLDARDRHRLRGVVRALEVAAATWQDGVERAAAEVGNRKSAPDAVPQHFGQPIDVNEAARMLNLTARQVRNLAPELGGVQVYGRWVLDGDTVRAEAARRMTA